MQLYNVRTRAREIYENYNSKILREEKYIDMIIIIICYQLIVNNYFMVSKDILNYSSDVASSIL